MAQSNRSSLQSRHHVAEGHGHRRCAHAFNEVGHGAVEAADFLALEITNSGDRRVAPNHSGANGPNAHEAQFVFLGKQFGQNRPVGIVHLPVFGQIAGQARKIEHLVTGVVTGCETNDVGYEIEQAHLEHAEDFVALEPQLVDGHDVCRDLAVAGLADLVAPEGARRGCCIRGLKKSWQFP